MISGLASTLRIDHRHHNTTTEEPRFNGVPRDWKNLFVKSWVGYIENLD